MNSKKLFTLLVAVLIFVNGAGVALFVMGNKYLEKQNTKLTSLKVEYETLDAVQRSLVKAKKDIQTYSELTKVVESVVPQEKDQAKTVREIIKIADESDVAIQSITFPSSSLGNTTPAAAAISAGTITQTQKVPGINGVERLEITITPQKNVNYKSFITFLQKLEQNRRTSQVSSINITPISANSDSINFSLVLNVYIKKAGS